MTIQLVPLPFHSTITRRFYRSIAINKMYNYTHLQSRFGSVKSARVKRNKRKKIIIFIFFTEKKSKLVKFPLFFLNNSSEIYNIVLYNGDKMSYIMRLAI